MGYYIHMTNQDIFKTEFANLIKKIHEGNKAKGFWDTERNKGELLMLIVSELGEALEGIRKPGPSEHIPEFTGEEEEIADALIRILDYAGGNNIRLMDAIEAKLVYNATRPHKHGKKF